MTWASRRQTIIIGTIAIIAIIILIPIVKPIIAPTPTCFDNKKNQEELGVDCSGSCQKICPSEATKISILWARPFEITTGIYSAVAYLSNPNATYEAKNVPYSLKLYDDKRILLAERTGFINIPPKSTLPIFEGGINVGKSKVGQASFEFKGEIDWQRSNTENPKLSISSPIVENEGLPKVTVTLKNNTSNQIKNLPLVAIVYDEDGNAMTASKTTIDSLSKNESGSVSFTWLSPFDFIVSRVEIYPDFSNI